MFMPISIVYTHRHAHATVKGKVQFIFPVNELLCAHCDVLLKKFKKIMLRGFAFFVVEVLIDNHYVFICVCMYFYIHWFLFSLLH